MTPDDPTLLNRVLRAIAYYNFTKKPQYDTHFCVDADGVMLLGIRIQSSDVKGLLYRHLRKHASTFEQFVYRRHIDIYLKDFS